MKLLLDTHVILWALSDSTKLPHHIREMLLYEGNEIYVSTISLWEIALKHKKNPNLLPYTANTIKEYCQRAGYIFLSINIDNIYALEKLNLDNNKDPFDQMLICQSVSNNMRLITHDEKIHSCKEGYIEYF